MKRKRQKIVPVYDRADRLETAESKFAREGVHKSRQVQIYGCDADGKLVWCGPHVVRRPSIDSARKLQRRWREWRYLYDHKPENVARDYPAKADARQVSLIGIMWQGACRWFRV